VLRVWRWLPLVDRFLEKLLMTLYGHALQSCQTRFKCLSRRALATPSQTCQAAADAGEDDPIIRWLDDKARMKPIAENGSKADMGLYVAVILAVSGELEEQPSIEDVQAVGFLSKLKRQACGQATVLNQNEDWTRLFSAEHFILFDARLDEWLCLYKKLANLSALLASKDLLSTLPSPGLSLSGQKHLDDFSGSFKRLAMILRETLTLDCTLSFIWATDIDERFACTQEKNRDQSFQESCLAHSTRMVYHARQLEWLYAWNQLVLLLAPTDLLRFISRHLFASDRFLAVFLNATPEESAASGLLT
jgi:hypothetical protein